MAKFYTCRAVVIESRGTEIPKLCLAPTKDGELCIDHIHERALAENRKRGWPFWP